ncbi:MAG TPA: hypothetical protein VH643_39700 [Gemmataceae bacterium]|jgi:hypothetical protein
MRRGPKAGDRVRLTTRDFEPDYRLSEAGTVESGPHFIPGGGTYFIVTMEKDGPGAPGIILRTCEIEAEEMARERMEPRGANEREAVHLTHR